MLATAVFKANAASIPASNPVGYIAFYLPRVSAGMGLASKALAACVKGMLNVSQRGMLVCSVD